MTSRQAAPEAHEEVAVRRGLIVRVATEHDLNAIVELRLALLREHAEHPIYGRLRADARARARRLFAAQLEASDEVTLLALRGESAIGILRCIESHGMPLLDPARYAYLASVYVMPGARRAGALHALVDAATAWCRERGLDEMRLHNAASNYGANAAWEALGFRIVEHLRTRALT